MNTRRDTLKRKGVALVFALFTIALLFSISTTIVAMSLSHSRDTRVVNYNDAALHAANWGIEAAVNYMGQPGLNYVASSGGNLSNINRETQWVDTQCYIDTIPSGRHLRLISKGADNKAVNNEVNVSVRSLDQNTMREYGLAYYGGQTLGEDSWNSSYSGSDKHLHSRAGSDTREISFNSLSGGGDYCIYYKDGTYAQVKVACTEIRYPVSNQPSKYQLVALAKVRRPKGGSPSTNDPILASRIVEANIRESMACDFMHFIQNARSWDAQGVDLGENTTLSASAADKARRAVFMPEGYLERGKLCIDGYDNKNDPEKSPLKMFLNKLGVDGTIGFLYNSSFNANKYNFESDVTTMRSADTYVKKQRGGNANPLNGVLSMFGGALNDGTPSKGMPESTKFFDNAKAWANHRTAKTGQCIADISIASSNSTSIASDYSSCRVKNSTNGKKCPDIAQGLSNALDENGNRMKSAVPTFATVRIELCGDKFKILKYNSALADNLGNVSADYIDNLTPNAGGSVGQNSLGSSRSISDITNGIINVTGGNVEVVNVRKFNNSGLSHDYVSDSDKGENGWFSDALTIASNVNAARDNSLNGRSGGSALYSDAARKHYEANPYKNIPPFSPSQLGTGTSTAKSVWPTPASSATEREGNIVIASDLLYGTNSNSSASLGIVAKNFILLNDKSGAKTSGSKIVSGVDKSKLKNLRVDGVLMSMDHSLQYDWNNLGCNSSSVVSEMQNKIDDEGSYRQFTLNGSIVSSFLDVEGDSYGRGYHEQHFGHDENLRYKLPPL